MFPRFLQNLDEAPLNNDYMELRNIIITREKEESEDVNNQIFWVKISRGKKTQIAYQNVANIMLKTRMEEMYRASMVTKDQEIQNNYSIFTDEEMLQMLKDSQRY